ncbi:hypothetical protein ACFOYW_04560 [Gryllotalpicola reticulitermitis]|uniref:DUF4254 domain-containing protein n=1 Tax=Gryllotalpicola reticulitermitis TaxID=1184153 RepID=A0ABV8Q2I3_9MICO
MAETLASVLRAAGVSAAWLVEDGLLSLDEPVSCPQPDLLAVRWWPGSHPTLDELGRLVDGFLPRETTIIDDWDIGLDRVMVGIGRLFDDRLCDRFQQAFDEVDRIVPRRTQDTWVPRESRDMLKSVRAICNRLAGAMDAIPEPPSDWGDEFRQTRQQLAAVWARLWPEIERIEVEDWACRVLRVGRGVSARYGFRSGNIAERR